MTRGTLERHQVWVYLAALLLGLAAGSVSSPGLDAVAEAAVWPVLAVLLFTTFTQVPLRSIPAAFTDKRFLLAAVIGNFVVVPVVVGALVWGLAAASTHWGAIPDDPVLRLGLLLVLLVPCTDWFITFAHLGDGDAAHATAFAPLSLLLQLALLPLYLRLYSGLWQDESVTGSVFSLADLWPAVLVVGVPLLASVLATMWAGTRPGRLRVVDALGWGPVPALGVVIALIALSHAGSVRDSLDVLPVVVCVAGAYLLLAPVLARALAGAARLPAAEGRTLAFTLGTRNSFIVLPFALTLPAGWEIAAVVVIMQSLIELFGMIAYLWFVPRYLFPGDRCGATA